MKAVAATKKKHVQQQQKREQKKKRADDDDNVAGDGRYDDIARKHQQLLQCQYCSSMLPHIPPLLEHQSSELEDFEYVLSVFVSLFISLCLCLSSSLPSTSPQLHLLARARALLRSYDRTWRQLGRGWVCAWWSPPRSSATTTTTTRFPSIHEGWMKIGGDDGNPNPKAGRQAGRQMKLSCYLPTNY